MAPVNPAQAVLIARIRMALRRATGQAVDVEGLLMGAPAQATASIRQWRALGLADLNALLDQWLGEPAHPPAPSAPEPAKQAKPAKPAEPPPDPDPPDPPKTAATCAAPADPAAASATQSTKKSGMKSFVPGVTL